jgi:pyrroloquinoline quinone biosynthesis protein B
MYVRVLGAAAGGGFPQWNCSCSNCRRLRQGTFLGTARSQAQLAISAGGENWILANASPDLRYQIESFPPLCPRPASLRQSPISAVILTSAEVDATLGLLLLRESQPFVIYATEAVRQILADDNTIFRVLHRQADQVQWRTIVPGKIFELQTCYEAPTGIQCTAVSVLGAFPGYVPPERASSLNQEDTVTGLFLQHGSKQIAFFPGAAFAQPEWLERMASCDVIFFDGTFWSEDELVRIQGRGKMAGEMGHSPVSGPGGTLERFSSLTGPRKVFIHINNTNPMLDEAGCEYRQVRAAGWELAFDGMEFSL